MRVRRLFCGLTLVILVVKVRTEFRISRSCDVDEALSQSTPLVFYNSEDKRYIPISRCLQSLPRWEGFRPRGTKIYISGWVSRRFFSAGFIDGELPDPADNIPWTSVSGNNMVYERSEVPKDVELLAEIVDAAEAVCTAQGQFTMMELGAACGPQLGHAIAINLRTRKLPMKLVAVEGDSSKIEMLKQNIVDNGASLQDVEIHQAAVHTKDGFVRFTNGGG